MNPPNNTMEDAGKRKALLLKTGVTLFKMCRGFSSNALNTVNDPHKL
jgi:hypothetical protein